MSFQTDEVIIQTTIKQWRRQSQTFPTKVTVLPAGKGGQISRKIESAPDSGHYSLCPFMFGIVKNELGGQQRGPKL